ncbi:MAG TPA: trypsin-like serine protease [Pseudonocardiaceae bacterium]
MKIRTALAGLALSALATVGLLPMAGAAPAQEPGVGIDIIGGGFATDAPWAARLFTDGQEFCTAALIAPTYVLTAEHCLTQRPGTVKTFRIGSLDQTSGGVTATAVDFWVNSEADIGVVRIDRPVYTTYAELGGSGDVQVSDIVQVYGWGATCTDRPEIECQSQFLKVADLKVTKLNGADYKGGVAICAKRVDGIPAGGDSGGPMFAGNHIVGVASTSDRDKHTCYASVVHYRDWIYAVSGI